MDHPPGAEGIRPMEASIRRKGIGIRNSSRMSSRGFVRELGETNIGTLRVRESSRELGSDEVSKGGWDAGAHR
jgi:hypothetical protein